MSVLDLDLISGAGNSPAPGQGITEEKLRRHLHDLAEEIVCDLNEHAPAGSQELLSAFVSELFLAATKQAIREERRKKQAEGIAKAKAKGVSFGRKTKPLPDNFEEARQLWLKRELNLKDAAKQVGGATIALNVTVASAVATGGAIDLSNLTVTCTQTSVSITDAAGNSYDFTIGGTGKVLTFTKASSQAQIDFDANLEVTYDFDGSGVETDKTAVENCYTQKVTLGVAKKNDQLAHADFKLTDSMVNSLLNGGKLHIGDAAISFNKDSKDTAANSVGVKDLLNSKGKLDTSDENVMKQLVARISVAAGGSNAFTVGAGDDATTISLQEKADYYGGNASKLLDTEEKIHNIVYLEGAADSSAGPLTLQIGDTSDSYNQLKVSIGDMHCKALGIDTLDISKPETASAAIQTIREAINSVSSVRGDLGAVQNRLEHTANNLSVMAENIQDAESTIRDTDVAEEMMAYTKNNILIQSAQAMLAQANAVPQGVLQLLG